MGRRGALLAAALLATGAMAAGPAAAAELDLRTANAATACTSVVLRRCAPAGQAAAPAVAPGQSGTANSGMAPPTTTDVVLEAVVIEGERLRRPPTVRELIEAAAATRTVREFESGEGGRCGCARPCPPWPQPCCQCTKGGRDAMIGNALRH